MRCACDCFTDRDDVTILDLRGERVAVVDDRIAIFPVPGVNLDAPAPGEQRADVSFDRRVRPKLIAHQVRVVRRIHEVFRQRQCHVIINRALPERVPQLILVAVYEMNEVGDAELASETVAVDDVHCSFRLQNLALILFVESDQVFLRDDHFGSVG